MSVIHPNAPSWRQLINDAHALRREAEAKYEFEQAQEKHKRASKRLLKLVQFWMCVSVLLGATLLMVLFTFWPRGF